MEGAVSPNEEFLPGSLQSVMAGPMPDDAPLRGDAGIVPTGVSGPVFEGAAASARLMDGLAWTREHRSEKRRLGFTSMSAVTLARTATVCLNKTGM